MLFDYEMAILRIVAESSVGYDWYRIAIRLSNTNVSERPHMLDTLRKMTKEDLLWFDSEKNRWHITDKGKAELEKEE